MLIDEYYDNWNRIGSTKDNDCGWGQQSATPTTTIAMRPPVHDNDFESLHHKFTSKGYGLKYGDDSYECEEANDYYLHTYGRWGLATGHPRLEEEYSSFNVYSNCILYICTHWRHKTWIAHQRLMGIRMFSMCNRKVCVYQGRQQRGGPRCLECNHATHQSSLCS